jgi:membrane-bound lytic murein transglycosylase D
VSLETLRALNPVLVRPVTPPGGPWTLVLPSGSSPSVKAALAPPAAPARPTAVAHAHMRAPAHPAPATPDTIHVVKPRDTVSSIAKKYGVTVADVLRWNRLEEQTRIRPGDRLRVADARPSVAHDGQGGFR